MSQLLRDRSSLICHFCPIIVVTFAHKFHKLNVTTFIGHNLYLIELNCLSILTENWGSLCGVVVNMLDCDVVSEFKF